MDIEPIDDQQHQQVQLFAVADEGLLTPNYSEMPIYVPLLKTTLTFGHFILISNGCRDPIVGHLLSRSNNPDSVKVCCFLPLFSAEANEHINNPPILPRKICSEACRNLTELVNVSKIATVPVSSILGIAFIFLESDIINHIFSVQGIGNAFVTRFKYCLSRKQLLPVDHSTFYCFPDLHPHHNAMWTKCYGRTIFLSLDHLRQEIWKFLFRYGQAQGLYPRQLCNLYYPLQFTNYLCIFLHRAGIPFTCHTLSEPQRRLDTTLNYHIISTADHYNVFCLDNCEQLQKLSQLIGATSVFGVRKRKPKKGSEHPTVDFDAMNILSRIDLYISYCKVKMRLYAYNHIVGVDATDNQHLISHLGTTQSRISESIDEPPRPISTLRINS
jgi:hypothetical protein